MRILFLGTNIYYKITRLNEKEKQFNGVLQLRKYPNYVDEGKGKQKISKFLYRLKAMESSNFVFKLSLPSHQFTQRSFCTSFC